MDLRRLEVFVKLMATRSFSLTGKELGLTQPTISGHIRSLEEQIGLTLFDRHRRSVRPTSAAYVLKEYAVKILDLHREAGFALERFKGKISGRLKLGGSTIPGGYILPSIMGRFHGLYPDTQLSLSLGDSQDISRLVYMGELELGMVGARDEEQNLEFEALVDDQMVLVTPRDHPWSQSQKIIKVGDLADTPFIIREEGSGTRTAMLEALGALGMGLQDLNVVAEMGSTEAVRQAVKIGLGVSILSRMAVEDLLEFRLVGTAELEGIDLSRRFFLVTNPNRTRSPLCEAFIVFLTAECRKTI